MSAKDADVSAGYDRDPLPHLVTLDLRTIVTEDNDWDTSRAWEVVSCLRNIAHGEPHTWRARVCVLIADQIEAQAGEHPDDRDPYDEPVYIQSRIPRLSHMHSEPVCAFPECETYLTREDMAAMQARVTAPTRCSTCGGLMTDPPCSKSPDGSFSGHTSGGGVAGRVIAPASGDDS